MLEKMWSKQTLLHYWWECKLVQIFWKLVWQFLRKMEINLPQGTAVPILHIYPKDVQSYHKVTCSTMSIAKLFVIQNL